ncbi:hypothetical protein H0H81_007112 [Sphagnurus paluster]|uniref:X-box-binding protein 1 n=1 Tax=Sphagnurus paluster TaxID=117069 RepID=A0A9P7GQY2_9AGAR|nr:hypothetical protein H0H81_007112 [Sphagnurus paluster]
MNHFIDPAALSESDVAASPSPSASGSSTSNPRKRPRTESSSEERKEARAHRNRIAAQNSRDRRKAQFSYLERRVAELEEENRALRAARGIPLLPVSASNTFQAEEEHKRLEASARDRENEELKERIKTLERGWDAVIKALAAQGLPLAPAPPQPQPAVVAPPPVFPISPAPSHASLDHSPSPAASPIPIPEPSEPQTESTRHLARVATIGAQRPIPHHQTTTAPPPPPGASASSNQTDPDDAAMESLLMEILASPLPAPDSPRPAAATADPHRESAAQTARPSQSPAAASRGPAKVAPAAEESGSVSGVEMMDFGLGAGMDGVLAMGTEWDSDNGLEMQRILASLGVAGEFAQEQEQQGLSELEIGWSLEGMGVDVF